MKYIDDYNLHQMHDPIHEKSEFWKWLRKSRKFGDLISMKRAIRLADEIAKLEYEKEERNRILRKKPDISPIDVEHELATYSKKVDNLRRLAEIKFGKSQFLTELIDERIAERMNEYLEKRLKESRRRNDTVEDKKYYKQVANTYKKEATMRTNELKQKVDTNFDFDSYEAKIRQRKFEEEMRHVRMEREVINNRKNQEEEKNRQLKNRELEMNSNDVETVEI